MLLRLPRPNPSRRRKKPSGLAVAGTIAAVAVVGLIVREAFSKPTVKPGGDLPGGELPGDGGETPEPPPPDSSGTVPKALLEIGFPEGMQTAAFTHTSGDVDNIRSLDQSEAVDVHSRDLPVEITVSLDSTDLKNLGVLSLGRYAKLIAGQSGKSRDLTFRVTGVDADEPAITVTTEHGFPGHMLLDTLRVFVT